MILIINVRTIIEFCCSQAGNKIVVGHRTPYFYRVIPLTFSRRCQGSEGIDASLCITALLLRKSYSSKTKNKIKWQGKTTKVTSNNCYYS
jgi:hypothetical protein